MKKPLAFLFIITLLVVSGCQTLQDKAGDLKNESQKTLDQASQQAEDAKQKILETKQKYDEKSQQLMDASAAVQKLAE